MAPCTAGDRDVGDLLDVAELVQRADDVLGLSFFEVAAGEVDVGGCEACPDIGDVQPEGREPALVQFDSDLLLEPALDLDGGDSRQRLEVPAKLFLGVLAEEVQVALPVQPQTDSRGRVGGRSAE